MESVKYFDKNLITGKREYGYYINISTKVSFLAHFYSLIGQISTLRNSGRYSKIGC
jgi:hypothetical protein